jgi:hypothetical protein
MAAEVQALDLKQRRFCIAISIFTKRLQRLDHLSPVSVRTSGLGLPADE